MLKTVPNTNIKINQSKMKTKSVSDKVLLIVIATFLTLLTLFLFAMFFWAIMTSLKSRADYLLNKFGFPTLSGKINSYEQFFHLKNYADVFANFGLIVEVKYYNIANELVVHRADVGFWGMFVNTIIYTLTSGLICAIIPAVTAYLCAKYNYKLSAIMITIYIVIMCIPVVGNYPTELSFLRNTGLYDTWIGNCLQKMSGGGMYFFVFYAFFKSMSNTYREAAEIDGASELRIMLSIYFPLAIKIIATVFLIQFVAYWNDYQTPLLYLPTHPTLSYGVYSFFFAQPKVLSIRDIPHQIAASVLLALPILVVFIIFKNKIMGDISLGGIKE